jgi:transcriptional regulator NrdR family protein
MKVSLAKLFGGGLACTKCGCSDMRVYYTRAEMHGVRRVRVCRHCGSKQVTHERAQGAALDSNTPQKPQ